MCQFLVWLRGRSDAYLLGQLASNDCAIGLAYAAWQENKLEAFVADLRTGKTDADVEPYVAKWQAELSRVGTPTEEGRAKYLTQVRTLIAKGQPYPLSGLTKTAIREWLSTKGSSSNRYRAALSSFAVYLVDAEVLAFNPVLSVKAVRPNAPRERYLSQDEARRVLDALSGDARVFHALAAVTALERQSIVRLRRHDVDLVARTVLGRATKTAARPRTAFVYDRWTWAWTIFTDYLKTHPMLPDATVFTGKADWYYRQLKDACEAVGIEDYTTHDWRHTWGVQATRDGLSLAARQGQLGHSNPSVTHNIYCRYAATAADYERNVTSNHTVQPTAEPAERAK